MSVYINHSTNDVSTNAGGKVTSGGNTVITSADTATDASAGVVELATTAEVQAGTDTGRVPSVSSLRGGLLVSGTPIATTSGTSVSISTSIPSWAKRIVLTLVGVSTSGTSPLIIRIGPSGGLETTSYVNGASAIAGGSVATASFTTGFGLSNDNAAARTYDGDCNLILHNPSSNTWVFYALTTYPSEPRVSQSSGSKSLSGVLTQISITTVGGTDTFDAGSVNIIYE